MSKKDFSEFSDFGQKSSVIPQMAVAVTKKIGAELGLPENTVEAAKAQALGTAAAAIVLQEFTRT